MKSIKECLSEIQYKDFQRLTRKYYRFNRLERLGKEASRNPFTDRDAKELCIYYDLIAYKRLKKS